MIKIINGTYGYQEGTRIVPKTADSPAFKLTPEKEARLVKLGVAKYVTAKEAATTAPSTPAGGQPEYNTGMKLDELKRIALEYGAAEADVKKATSKAKAIELIEQAKAVKTNAPEPEDNPEDEPEDEGNGEDGEGGDATPPSLTPTDPGE